MIHPKYVIKECKNCHLPFKVSYKRRVFRLYCSSDCKKLYHNNLIKDYNKLVKSSIRRRKGGKNGR